MNKTLFALLLARLGFLAAPAATPITADLTLTKDHNGAKLVNLTGTARTITVPAGLPVNFTCDIIQKGAGQLTIAGSGATVASGGATLKTLAANAKVAIDCVAADSFVVNGALALS